MTTTIVVAGKGGLGKTAIALLQTDSLSQKRVAENDGQELALEYQGYSLVISAFNSHELNGALDTLRQVSCIAFGPEESFGTAGYQRG